MARTLKVRNIHASEVLDFSQCCYMVEGGTVAPGETKLIYNDKAVWGCPLMEDYINLNKAVLLLDDAVKSKDDSLALATPSHLFDVAKV